MTSKPNSNTIPNVVGNSSSAASNANSGFGRKRKSNDVGWEFGILIDEKNQDKVQCILCKKVFSGGVYHLKEHVANIQGNVAPCRMATNDNQLRCRQAIADAKNKKKNKKKEEEVLRAEVNIGDEDELEEIEGLGPRKDPKHLSPMDRFASPINPDSSISGKNMQQRTLNDTIIKERTHATQKYVAKWVYQAGIPFNAIDNDSFLQMVEAIGRFGPSFKPPSQWQLREPFLKEEFESTKEALKKQEESWKIDGCSIMMDAWSDKKRRSIMNLCVNCKEGTTFLSSKESSDVAHTGEYIFNYVLAAIEEVGPENVVQVVTDNASNNMAAAKMLKEKMTSIFWTSCATHTINLMLESIGKLPRFKKTLNSAKSLTIFIYAHHTTLALMRTFTKKRDIVMPGVTRFASAFLTLQSILEKKDRLRAMFISSDWDKCKWSKSVKGKAAYSTVLSTAFWNGVNYCLRVFAPLVRVLRLVDGDRKPSMGFLYGELKRAKEEIREALKNVESNYRPIFEIIEAKSKGRLDSPLHLAAYVLNPYYFFNGSTSSIYTNEVSDGFCNFAEILYPDDLEKQNLFMNIEFGKYLDKEGSFRRPLAMKGCEKNDEFYNPVTWWINYGSHTPNLQRIAKRILSLTTSSSGCERNWSTFEGIHTKKRNRLDTARLNNLVYVQFNSRLMDKRKRGTEEKIDILLANDASNAQGWIVEDGDDEVEPGSGLTLPLVGEAAGADEFIEHQRSGRNEVRDLEDEFESDNEAVEENVEFESDDDCVFELLEEYVVEDEELDR